MSGAASGKPHLAAAPWLVPWPAAELETVDACPVCASATREILHEHLIDNVFRVAAGRWTMYRCTQCRSAYLDPRPNEASMGKAYADYYTHDDGRTSAYVSKPGFLRRLKLSLFNGYVNRRYGTERLPAMPSGAWALALMPRQEQRLDVEFRYLPKPEPGQTLLDIGCGNGDFLANAKAAGWSGVGIDTDAKAVEVAARRGLDVRVGSVERIEATPDRFDAITLSHVLEHVHDPRGLVRTIRRLLKPGGVVYIDTPNICSRGAARWRTNWRGLEAPRHLVLFNLHTLSELLQAEGFGFLQIKRRTAVRKFIYLCSLRMQRGRSPLEPHPPRLPVRMRLCLKYRFIPASQDEFLTLLARKQGG